MMPVNDLQASPNPTRRVPTRLAKIYSQGWYLEELAGQLGVSIATAHRHLYGETRHAEMQRRMAELVGLHPEDLFETDCFSELRRSHRESA